MGLLVLQACVNKSTPVPPTPTSATANSAMIVINSAGDKLAFDVTQISLDAEPGTTIQVRFNNTAQSIRHNWVLVKGDQTIASLVNTDGEAAGGPAFLPKQSEHVLAATQMIEPGQSETLSFSVPAPGSYAFLCTFPGHYLNGMRGVLTVKGEVIPPAATAPTAAPQPTVQPSTRQAPLSTAAPAPTATPFAKLGLPPADEASARLKVPKGFAVRIFARDLNNPRLMTVGPDGYLYVAEREGSLISRLADRDNDGLADAHETVANNADHVHSVAWFEGSLYAAELDKVEKFTDKNKDGDFEDEGERETVTNNIPAGGGHTTRTVHFGPDGKMYISAGSEGNNEPGDDPRRASILRFNSDGSIPQDNPFADDADEQRHPVWAEGLRNSVDFLFLPDGRLWANHNGSDGLGDDVPPEEVIIQVERGKHYGWPWCYTPALGKVKSGDKEVRDERVAFTDNGPIKSCAEATPALFTDLAHQAPIGMTFYDQAQFPARYRGNIFQAYRGSWDSSVPRDCKVQMIVLKDGQPVSSEPFLTGFRDKESDACDKAWGRPTGLATGANGELFVADGEQGKVYRVIYAP